MVDVVDDEWTAEDEEREREREWRNLRRSVWAEAVLGLAVLAATAVLVERDPVGERRGDAVVARPG